MIVGVTGYARSGKDSVAVVLCEDFGFCRLAFADLLREAVYRFNPWVYGEDSSKVSSLQSLVNKYGWEGAKAYFPEVRRCLQVMGTEVGRGTFGDNAWVDALFKQITNPDGSLCSGDYVITDVRFPNEADAIRSRAFSTPFGGHIWRVVRPHNEPVNAHPSETAMLDYPDIACTISNDGDLTDLRERVVEALHYSEHTPMTRNR